MNEPNTSPEPVTGDVVGRSLVKTLGSVLFMILVFVFGLFLIWAWWTDTGFERFGSPHKVTWWGFLLGIGAVLGAPLLVASLVRRLLARERLVIGGDRLQIVRRRGGHDAVVFQIPYANVARCSYEVTSTERRIGIDLVDPDDPATYAGGENFQTNKEFTGWHYTLGGGYQTGVADIHKLLAGRMGRPGP